MIYSIIPPYMLKHLTKSHSHVVQSSAWNSLMLTERLRGQFDVRLTLKRPKLTSPGDENRDVRTANGTERLPGLAVRGEGEAESDDAAVNQVYEGFGATYDLYKYYDRNSIDGNGMRMTGTVHYSRHYDNAFWNGEQMVFGDGDGVVFTSFTKPIDVTGHELTHGVTQYTANLNYQDQSGSLNESMSDVFGSLVKQRFLKQSADQADWIIGQGMLAPGINGVGLRSMKAPGTAYDDPQLGKDPQPANMSDYLETSDDSGGVHTNSGIPNHAFYLAAAAIGGWAWEKAGKIWYTALKDVLRPDSDFKAAADATAKVAASLFGDGGKEHQAVKAAWEGVGVGL